MRHQFESHARFGCYQGVVKELMPGKELWCGMHHKYCVFNYYALTQMAKK